MERNKKIEREIRMVLDRKDKVRITDRRTDTIIIILVFALILGTIFFMIKHDRDYKEYSADYTYKEYGTKSSYVIYPREQTTKEVFPIIIRGLLILVVTIPILDRLNLNKLRKK